MPDEASPPFNEEEAGLATKTMWKMIYRYTWMWYIDTCESWDIPGQSMAVLDIPRYIDTYGCGSCGLLMKCQMIFCGKLSFKICISIHGSHS